MVKGGAGTSHQYIRAKSSEVGSSDFNEIQRRVPLHMDNMVALSYLVKMGGTQCSTLLDLAKQIWDYLLCRKITITVEYLPSHSNVTADWQPRHVEDRSEWNIPPRVFQQQICQQWVTPEIDLFAVKVSFGSQLISRGNQTHETDAMQQAWSNLFPYAFPTFSLISGL